MTNTKQGAPSAERNFLSVDKQIERDKEKQTEGRNRDRKTEKDRERDREIEPGSSTSIYETLN